MQHAPVTIILIAINVVFSMIGFSSKEMLARTILWPYYIKRKNEYHRFVTSGFLHADYMHLFFNMFTLYFFGSNVEWAFNHFQLGGTSAYVGLYVGALIVSDLPSYFKHQDNFGYRALGASGAVSAVVFASIVFNPWGSIYLYGAIKISAAVYAVLFILYCVYMSKKGNDHINHDAHLWGALFGFACTLILVGIHQPELFQGILEELKRPSLFGRE